MRLGCCGGCSRTAIVGGTGAGILGGENLSRAVELNKKQEAQRFWKTLQDLMKVKVCRRGMLGTPVARQKNIWSLLEQFGLSHLMVEAARRIVEVLVSEKVHVVAVLGFIHLRHLEPDKERNSCVRVQLEPGHRVRTGPRKENQVKKKEQIQLLMFASSNSI